MKKLLPPTIILVVFLLTKIPFTSQGFFAFTYDQGRDLLTVARMIYEGKITLIGPTTGLQGIFYGPTWYYFLSPLMYLSGGNPQGVADFIGVFAIVTILAIYFLLIRTTANSFLAFALTLVASMSASWMFAPTLIWSPTIVTFLMVLLFLFTHKIFTKPRPVYFFAVGALSILIGDGGAAFGVIMTIALLLSPLVFKKYFFKKEFLFTITGLIVAASPRIVFDLKHDFLISRSALAYISEPKIYGEHEPIISRLTQRLDLFWGIFAQSFSENNKIAGLLIFLIIMLCAFLVRKRIKDDKLLQYAVFLIVALLVGFSIFPDIVWNYYLVGLPIIFLVAMSRVFLTLAKDKKYKKVAMCVVVLLILINFNKGLFTPFKLSWLGDGATYRNQKMVMDYIASQNPHDYSLYAYTPAIFDYPFDYLVYWYVKQGKLEAPKERQNLMFLVLRDFSNKRYLESGWYGDKTRDNTMIMDKKEFIGDIVVEKHQIK